MAVAQGFPIDSEKSLAGRQALSKEYRLQQTV